MPEIMKKIVRPVTQPQPGADLPAAGHAQREVLKQREDELAEKVDAAQHSAEGHEVGSIDPDTFNDDIEIMANFDGLDVSNRQPGFEYKWVRYDSQYNIGYWVNHAKVSKWQVVCGDMPEAKEHEIAGGMRKIGDCVLMRIPAKFKAALDRREQQDNEHRRSAASSNLQELGKSKGVIVKTTDTDPDLLQRMSAQHRGTMAATTQYTQALKDGTIVGLQ